jgi:hypothetical protein
VALSELPGILGWSTLAGVLIATIYRTRHQDEQGSVGSV